MHPLGSSVLMLGHHGLCRTTVLYLQAPMMVLQPHHCLEPRNPGRLEEDERGEGEGRAD